MRKLFLLAAILVFASASAETKQGGITEEMMAKIRTGYTASTAERAARNALSTTAISSLVTNGENLTMIDTHFSDEIKISGITNQRSSGRCWLFTALNVLRAEMNTKYDLKEFEFSENYCSFHDLLEKGNLFLQSVIDTRKLDIYDRKVSWLMQHPIGDGGVFTGAANLIMKYGVVPKDAMPETFQSENTRGMRDILALKLRGWAMELRQIKDEKAAMERKTEHLTEFYRILVECLGVPPTEFEWTMYDKSGKKISTEKYTPKGFYEKYIGEGGSLNTKFVMLMNDPSREYGKVYEIDMDRHLYDGNNWLYVNLPIERIKELAIKSIKGGTPMSFSCDVGKFLDRKKGTIDIDNYDYESLFATSFPMNKAERIQSGASGSSHAMTLIAVDIDGNGATKKWMVENSWGDKSGYKGRLIMTDKWFDEYMFRLVVERRYVPEDILEMMKQKPILLPAWDPLAQPED